MKNKRISIALAAALIWGSSLSMQQVIAMAKDYPFSIAANVEGKKATIRITGTIWRWHNNAEEFRRQIERYNAQGVTHLHIYINTPGGSVIEANEIVNIIREFSGKVTGEGGALVASAGTYIALECETFEMPENGQWMYHKPIADIRGNEDQVESQLKGLKNFTLDYKKRYAAKSKLTAKQIEKNWVKGDVWLNAEDALKDGFITGIKKGAAAVSEDTAAMIAACGSPIALAPTTNPNPQNPPVNPQGSVEPKNNPNTITMNELEALALKIGLPQNSTQAQVDAKLAELSASAAKVTQLEAEAQAKEAADRQKAVRDLLDGAVRDKKIDAKQSQSLESWANQSFEECKAYIDGLPALKAISESVKGTAAPITAAPAVGDKPFEALTQEEIAALESSDPQALQAKYEAYLNK